jgi:SAM-dependent methyltransferase
MNFIQQWLSRRKRNQKIQHTLSICHEIYQHISGFHLAKQARSDQQLFSYEYLYGEIDYLTFAQLLLRCTIHPDTVFYDLGSGTGKAVVFAALLLELKQACGIEQLTLLHESAKEASNHLIDKNIHFYQADLLRHPWHHADLVFVNATAFIGDFWQQVLEQLKKLQAGTQIIIVTKQLPADHFKLIYQDFLPMSWGLARVGIYRAA